MAAVHAMTIQMLTFAPFVIMLVGTEIFREKSDKGGPPITNKNILLLIGFSIILLSLAVGGCAEKKADVQVSGMVKSVSAFDNSLGQDYQVDVIITNTGQDTISFQNIYAFFDSTGYENDPMTIITDRRNVTLAPGDSIPGSYSSEGSTQELVDASKNGNIGFRIGFITNDNVAFTTSAILPRLEAKNGQKQEMDVGDTAVLIFASNEAVTKALNS